MRAVVQRVKMASVTIDAKLHNEIEKGLLVLLGIENDDTDEDIDWVVRKVSNMRIFNDDEGVMNKSLLDIKGEVLIISQFTLFASTKKGNRPSYLRASKPPIAVPLYEHFLKEWEESTKIKAKAGVFGAEMKVSLLNDGPVTIIIDSKNKE